MIWGALLGFGIDADSIASVEAPQPIEFPIRVGRIALELSKNRCSNQSEFGSALMRTSTNRDLPAMPVSMRYPCDLLSHNACELIRDEL